ncbi:hypothetical protein BGX27_007557 [Mortierella sp. AM989]|nr:hypothetical protein BGX27_007557 [Mortierella sp. AM989]
MRNQQLTKGKVKTVLRYKSIDVTKLKDAITQYGTDQWNIISVKVFKSEVSPESLKRYYLEWERKRKRWWESQNEQLVRAVFDTCKKNQLALPLDAIDITTPTEKETAKALLEKIDVADILNKDHWQTIAENVSGEHTASECRERWIRMQSGQGAWDRIFGRLTSTQNSNNYYNNNDNNNIDSDQSIISESVNSLPAARIRWSSEQSRRLEKIVIATRGSPSWKRHGWENVSKLMNHEFTRQQCKSRWIRLLGESKVSHTNNTDANTDTNINNDNNNMYSRSNCGWLSQWSRGEIEHLIMGIHEFGFNWGDTQQKWVQGRTTKSCHAKWRTLNAKLHLEMKIRQNPWSKVCTDIYGDEMGKILAELPERWPTICDERKNVKSQ